MERKPTKQQPDDPEHYRPFLEAAERAGATKTAKEADKAFRSVEPKS
jgi:hypothetical protein